MPNNVICKSQVKGLHYLVYCEATVKCLIENLMPCLAGIIFLDGQPLSNDYNFKLLNLFHLYCQKSNFLFAVTFTVLKMWLMQYMYNYLLIVLVAHALVFLVYIFRALRTWTTVSHITISISVYVFYI